MMHIASYRMPVLIATLAACLVMGSGSAIAPLQAAERAAPTPEGMAYIPFGAFLMGVDGPTDRTAHFEGVATARERLTKGAWSAEAFHDEGPVRTVTLDGYFIDLFEVSNRQYGEFMKATNHPAPAHWDDPRLNQLDQPVVGVNWFDAKAYCEWKGKRLPTEAEWEKSARGPAGNRYPWGNQLDPRKANYNKQHDRTAPVDSYPEGASYYGVRHMAGNVFEWVADWYDPTFYETTEQTMNPTGPAKPIWLGGTGTYVDRLTVGEKRVIRGGSWIAAEASITTTHRFWNHPLNNSYGVGLGFRCAQTAPIEIDRKIREAHIRAMISMGREDYASARTFVEQGLRLEPTNESLRLLREQNQKTLKSSKRLAPPGHGEAAS